MTTSRPTSASGTSRPGSATGPSAPLRLKDYVFSDKLGSGTYASVYKAFRKDGTRQIVAVKCVERRSLNKNSEDNLVTEIGILKEMKHEFIVELKDFQWDNNYIYLIMEYCGGGDLSRFIHSRRCLSEQLARKFLQQIAQALQYLREHDVSHMDLKPQNILLSSGPSPVIKLADFGFAQYLRSHEDVSMLRGSPLYMAPEIIIHRLYSPKADLWSLGVILYECLFGQAPFASKTFRELEEKIRDTKPVELPLGADVSDKCHDLLTRLLQRDHKKRIEFQDFFAHSCVDLEHMPCAESLSTAVRIVTQAVESDQEGFYYNAIKLYSEALEHFVAAVRYESDAVKKQALRKRVQDYIDRAETLKQMHKPKPRHIYRRTDSQASYDELVRYAIGDVKMEEALKTINKAEVKEQAEDYASAMTLYQDAFDELLKLLRSEPNGRRKELLHAEVKRWMSRAEEIKLYLDARKAEETCSELARQNTDNGVEEEQSQLMEKGRCLVQ